MLGEEYHHKKPAKDKSHTALTKMVHGYRTLFGTIGRQVNCAEEETRELPSQNSKER
tara:strand:+ start:147 stop:317 length:171 start_codon:yes stop_codon:yes gene_type:complete